MEKYEEDKSAKSSIAGNSRNYINKIKKGFYILLSAYVINAGVQGYRLVTSDIFKQSIEIFKEEVNLRIDAYKYYKLDSAESKGQYLEDFVNYAKKSGLYLKINYKFLKLERMKKKFDNEEFNYCLTRIVWPGVYFDKDNWEK